MSGVHPQIKVGDEGFTSCVVRSRNSDEEVFEPGRQYEVTLELMFWAEYGRLVREDLPIELFEGSRLVARGEFVQ
jgi:hypothetical protein